jgi:preprotein translocase subunit SecG
MLFTFLLVVQGLVAAGLIGVILMQKSEGGGLGVGGSPAGFLSARGAADFLTRATAILATVFVGLSIALAVLASVNHSAAKVDTSAVQRSAPAAPLAPPAGAVPVGGAPVAGAPVAGAPAAPLTADPLSAAAAGASPPAAPAENSVPLQQ